MSEPVRLRGEVGERRLGLERRYQSPVDGRWSWSHTGERSFNDPWMYLDKRRYDRRTNLDLAARIDAIVAHLNARRLADLQEAQAEIQRLTLLLNEHMDEVCHMTGTVEHLRAENERLRGVIGKAADVVIRCELGRVGNAEALLASGCGAGTVGEGQ